MDWISSGQMPEQQADGAQAPSAHDLPAKLAAILAELDAGGEAIAATYVQMAIDVLRDSNARSDSAPSIGSEPRLD